MSVQTSCIVYGNVQGRQSKNDMVRLSSPSPAPPPPPLKLYILWCYLEAIFGTVAVCKVLVSYLTETVMCL